MEDLIIEHDLWHSRRLASPQAFAQPLDNERAAEKSAYHHLVQIGPDGKKTLYLAAHAKLVLGRSFEQSQKLIWELIDHCTQPKVSPKNSLAGLCVGPLICTSMSSAWSG